MINIYTDGGARGNPGPSAIGVYVEDENKKEIISFGKKIGVATNNVAEYTAVINAFDYLLENNELLMKLEIINFFLDSNLVVSQLRGLFKIKNANLRELLFKIKEKESQISAKIYYHHIPREQNKKADKLVNLALDNKLSG